MKRKVNPVEAAPLPTCTAIGAEDMVLVACPAGDVFLVERNTAIVSNYCRGRLQLWEGAVRRLLIQSKMENSESEGTTVDSTMLPHITSEPVLRRREGGGVSAAEVDPVSIPFMRFLDDGFDGPGAFPLDAIEEIPVSVVAERYQARQDDADVTANSRIDRPSSKPYTNCGDRKGMHMVVSKPLSLLSALEDDNGVPMYPVVVVPYVTPALMEAALTYAQRKYKLDIDGEKPASEAGSPTAVDSVQDRWRLIASAALMNT